VREQRLSWLSTDELARYERLPALQRHEYLTARALCRATLSRYTGIDPPQWRFGKNPYGKPEITAPSGLESLCFNLTHTDGLAICLVSRAGEVGVDAEETSRTVDVALVARHFLSRHQQARLARLSPHERAARFFEQWVLKEAYVKAIGTGLAYAPQRLTVEQGEGGQPAAIANCQFSVYRPSSKHLAAAAVFRRDLAAAVSIEWLIAADLLD